jgi:branched-chain amino acid transport system permease protein
LAFLVLPALAAALIGGFQRPGVTIVAGFVIAMIEGLGSLWEPIAVYRSSLPFFLIALVLIWQQRSEVWEDAR